MKKSAIELFAGVGGFRVGLNHVTYKKGIVKEENRFSFVWANQWEPSTKIQHAYDCYVKRFGNKNNEVSNQDISLVDKNTIPEHSLLTGGFPCQDYSVAHSLSKEKGIEGKKGVLWWQIKDILVAKKTPFVFLENVDRLLKSPAKQRGRDFGIMLRCLNDLGYAVEWRVINAAEYGFAQRRRRIYIFAYKNTTNFYKQIEKETVNDVFTSKGIFAKSFEINKDNIIINKCNINEYKDLVDVSDKFSFNFENSGLMIDGTVYTTKTIPIFKKPTTLAKIVVTDVDNHYYLSKEQAKKFEYLRGGKKIPRVDSKGFKYMYSEGAMSPYDELSLPGRTMLTSEGSINRSTHIVKDPITNNLRILTPVECERLNNFPDDWTNVGMPERRRYFMMGNALVCGIIKVIGQEIEKIIEEEK